MDWIELLTIALVPILMILHMFKVLRMTHFVLLLLAYLVVVWVVSWQTIAHKASVRVTEAKVEYDTALILCTKADSEGNNAEAERQQAIADQALDNWMCDSGGGIALFICWIPPLLNILVFAAIFRAIAVVKQRLRTKKVQI